MDKSGEPFIAKSLEELLVRDKALSVNQSWQINRRRDQARENFLRQWMATARETSTGRPIDGIICPPGFGPAPKHGQFVYQSLVIYNTLDLPSTVVPVTTADSTLDPVDQNFAPASERDQTVHDIYDPEGSHGLPVSVQLVGRPFREEALLQMTSVLDAAVRAAAPIQ